MSNLTPREILELKNINNGLRNGKLFRRDNAKSLIAADAKNVAVRVENDATKTVKDAAQAFADAEALMNSAHTGMMTMVAEIGKKSKDAVSRSKDLAQQMADSMNKITKVVGPDFENRLSQLQQLVDCMERLSALQDAGKLAPMLEALKTEGKLK